MMPTRKLIIAFGIMGATFAVIFVQQGLEGKHSIFPNPATGETIPYRTRHMERTLYVTPLVARIHQLESVGVLIIIPSVIVFALTIGRKNPFA
jgi:hypothetical protein